ncbi:concanavalin A-like lectin/glucanases superfamily-domain-containing protein [Gigaspora rosea]|uniref:Concanavalin A-like lectin/glucanases superfamily-domain-containing protein n=1 Tax=Gigaspora rosea TaxID=44941 RepID=A0A397TWE2_9GLOM|nr:concanavalin A-like lectin/glucanases superfamily-domain-containing protein [Gigaspora rosea]
MAKFASPNKPITSTILPPRKKLTTQLPSRNSILNDKEIDLSNYLEIFSEPTYFPTNKTTIQHKDLPAVTNELSVTFQLNLEKLGPNQITIFNKGEDKQKSRSPALFLSQKNLKPYPYCSLKHDWAYDISAGNNLELNICNFRYYNICLSADEIFKDYISYHSNKFDRNWGKIRIKEIDPNTGNNLELNKWYHIAYTLSEPQKRMQFYVNGELVAYTDVKNIIFNEFPLKIGHYDDNSDFQGQMSNFRYYNICLSADEIFKDYISYHSNKLGFKGYS